MVSSNPVGARRFVTRQSGIHGKGVFATRFIPVGERVIEYKGERITDEESARRYPYSTHTFLFLLDEDITIDGGVKGNSARWINHSCDPNCEATEEHRRIYFESIRPINPGDEITIDYNLYVEGRYTEALKREYACRCGSPLCRGTFLGDKRIRASAERPGPALPSGNSPEYVNMRRKYWEEMAPAYDEAVFDVLLNDRKGVIRAAIAKVAAPGKTAIDIGCAVGKWLPVLAPDFRKVYALDISAKNLALARQRYPEYPNIDFVRADMSRKGVKVPRADVGICINAILTPSRRDREAFFANLGACIKKGGTLILGLPSLESAMLASLLAARWRIDPAVLNRKLTPDEALRKWNHLREGNVEIDSLPHKHYLREEVDILLSRAGFRVGTVEKVEYDWDTEFIDPPNWLDKPGPWSWVITATRR